MDKIFEKANDQHVRNFVLYGKSEDNTLYYDSANKVAVEEFDDVKRLFEIGALLINDGTNVLVPVALTSNSVKTIGESSQTLAFVEWTIASE